MTFISFVVSFFFFLFFFVAAFFFKINRNKRLSRKRRNPKHSIDFVRLCVRFSCLNVPLHQLPQHLLSIVPQCVGILYRAATQVAVLLQFIITKKAVEMSAFSPICCNLTTLCQWRATAPHKKKKKKKKRKKKLCRNIWNIQCNVSRYLAPRLHAMKITFWPCYHVWMVFC